MNIPELNQVKQVEQVEHPFLEMVVSAITSRFPVIRAFIREIADIPERQLAMDDLYGVLVTKNLLAPSMFSVAEPLAFDDIDIIAHAKRLNPDVSTQQTGHEGFSVTIRDHQNINHKSLSRIRKIEVFRGRIAHLNVQTYDEHTNILHSLKDLAFYHNADGLITSIEELDTDNSLPRQSLKSRSLYTSGYFDPGGARPLIPCIRKVTTPLNYSPAIDYKPIYIPQTYLDDPNSQFTSDSIYLSYDELKARVRHYVLENTNADGVDANSFVE